MTRSVFWLAPLAVLCASVAAATTAATPRTVVPTPPPNGLWNPAPPPGVTATAGYEQVTIDWQLSEGATTYTLYRKAATEPVFSELATGLLAPPFVDTGLADNTRYYYQVRALTTVAQSVLSSTVSAVTARISPTLHRSGRVSS